MRKYLVLIALTLTVGLTGCSSTGEGGDKGSSKRSSSAQECADLGSRIKKRC